MSGNQRNHKAWIHLSQAKWTPDKYSACCKFLHPFIPEDGISLWVWYSSPFLNYYESLTPIFSLYLSEQIPGNILQLQPAKSIC